ncbi:unnamed protein product [Calypogeia fissa]
MPRPSTAGSLMSSTVKENKPLWCSPGRPYSTLLRTGKGKPLGELKSGNRTPSLDGGLGKSEKAPSQIELKCGNRSLSLDGPGKAGKVLIPAVKKAPDQKGSPGRLKSRLVGAARAPSQVPAARVPSPVPSRPKKTTKAPLTEETPPRTRPTSKKPLAALVTPTNNRFRKPVPTAGTPKGTAPKITTTPKGGILKGRNTPGSRAREKNQTLDETPVKKVRERPRTGTPPTAAQGVPKSGSRDGKQQQQGVSGWAGSATAARGRKASPTHTRPPVKHLFLSPQVSKKTAKKEFVRKSIENHGIWVGSAVQRKRASPAKKGVDSEMPPPAQPTNSPEIPKRGSREASGEGIRGYFGAGHMVAPEGVGFVRDRRKCKPRGTLMIGQEGLSIDTDSSSGIVESSVQMPPPSVASVEWMMNNGGKEEELDDFSSGSLHEPLTTSLSEFTIRDNQVGESFGEHRTSQENGFDDSLGQLELSSLNDKYSQFTKRSQAFLLHLEMRQSQLSRAVSFSHVRGPRHYSREESLRSTEHLGFGYSDLEYEDVTIDWRQGLPCESMEVMEETVALQEPTVKNEEIVRSPLSFTSSWVPHSEDSRRLSGHAKSWYAPDSQWYGFSPITPEFHRNSQLPDGGSKAIDALLAGSVRRRIMTDQSTSSDHLDMSCTSLPKSMQLVNPGESSSGLSSSSSQETSSSFQFARNSYARGSDDDMVQLPLDNVMCQTSSPIERSPYSGDNLCQTASPIEEVYNVACSIDCSVAGSIDCSVDCSIDCTVYGSDDDEVEYASPTMGDYLSPVKSSSPPAKSEKGGLYDETNMGARAMRRSSMSRTLVELMRHNFTL